MEPLKNRRIIVSINTAISDYLTIRIIMALKYVVGLLIVEECLEVTEE